MLLSLWDLSVRYRVLPPSQAALPFDVISTLWHLLSKGTLFTHTAFSLLRLSAGVSIGCVMAVILSLCTVLSPVTSTLVSPTVQVLAGVPVILWMPFCVMLFGTGELYKVSLLAIGTFFLVQIFVVHSLRSTERRFVELAEMYQKTKVTRIRHMLLPASLPAIIVSTRAALASGWIVLFFVEFATSEQGREGLGWFIADTRHAGRIEEEFAGLVWLGMLAFLLDRAIAKYQTHRLRWFDPSMIGAPGGAVLTD